MSETSIKVQIAGRTYPLTVSSAELARIRLAESAIDESIEIFQKNYAVKDKQDLLAMAALQMASKQQPKPEKVVEKVIEKVVETVEVPADMSTELLALESALDAYLK
ncbi:MAG: cell division protein ZapA [Flavobacteriales bacterium]